METLCVIGCYISPNITIDTYSLFIEELNHRLSVLNGEKILAGDFNAKSVKWGYPPDDRRGELLAEMALSIGLVVLNTGAPTFVTRDTTSHIDVTFASHKLARDLTSWELLDDECLSPHKHILLTLCHKGIKKMTIRRVLSLDCNKFQKHLTQWFNNKTENAIIQTYQKL